MTSLDTLDPDDRVHASQWLNRAAFTQPDKLRFELELLARNRQVAFLWLVANIPLAFRMARDAGWLPNAGDQPSAEDLALAEIAIRDAISHLQAIEDADAKALRQHLEALGIKRLGPHHLPPDVLDQLNPLPNGHKRAQP